MMSAMKRPTIPKTPPLAPTTSVHGSSNAALKSAPAILQFRVYKLVFELSQYKVVPSGI